MFVLKTWSTDIDLKPINSEPVELVTFDTDEIDARTQATAEIVRELANEADAEFICAALTQWFTTGRISGVPEGNNIYWSAELTEV